MLAKPLAQCYIDMGTKEDRMDRTNQRTNEPTNKRTKEITNDPTSQRSNQLTQPTDEQKVNPGRVMSRYIVFVINDRNYECSCVRDPGAIGNNYSDNSISAQLLAFAKCYGEFLKRIHQTVAMADSRNNRLTTRVQTIDLPPESKDIGRTQQTEDEADVQPRYEHDSDQRPIQGFPAALNVRTRPTFVPFVNT